MAEKRKSEESSEVWNYFNKNISDPSKPSCKRCKKVVSRGKSGSKLGDLGTTPLKAHLKSCNQSKSSTQQLSLKQTFEKKTMLDRNSPTAVTISRAIGNMVAIDLRPYSIVENKGFQEHLKILQPRYQMITRVDLSQNIVPKIFEELEQKVLQSVNASKSFLNFTTDMWKSDNQNREFMAVSGHWVGENIKKKCFEIRNALLTIEEYKESAHAYNIRRALRNVSQKWLNGDQFHIGVSDNAANVTLALNPTRPIDPPENAENLAEEFGGETDGQEEEQVDDEIEDFEEIEEEITLRPVVKGSVGCFAHTLNLIVEDALKPNVQRTITDAKVHCEQIVTKHNQSMPVARAFKAAQKATTRSSVSLKRSVSTRWNSTLIMFRSFISNKEAVTALYSSKRFRKLKLPPLPQTLGTRMNFWDLVEGLVKILTPFEEATLEVSKESSTLAECIPFTQSLLRSLRNMKSGKEIKGLDTFMNALIQGITTRLIEKESMVHEVATFLNPRYKFILVPDEFKRDDIRDHVLMLLKNIQKSETSYANQPSQQNLEAPTEEEPAKGALLSTLDDILNERLEEEEPVVQLPTGSITPEQELAAYLAVGKFRVAKEKDALQELLSFWYDHKDQWPLLTKLALSYLACPPSSVTSERVFSLAGNIVTKKRCALLSGNISKLAFIKYNHDKF